MGGHSGVGPRPHPRALDPFFGPRPKNRGGVWGKTPFTGVSGFWAFLGPNPLCSSRKVNLRKGKRPFLAFLAKGGLGWNTGARPRLLLALRAKGRLTRAKRGTWLHVSLLGPFLAKSQIGSGGVGVFGKFLNFPDRRPFSFFGQKGAHGRPILGVLFFDGRKMASQKSGVWVFVTRGHFYFGQKVIFGHFLALQRRFFKKWSFLVILGQKWSL